MKILINNHKIDLKAKQHTTIVFSDFLQWWFVNPGSDRPEISLVRTKSAGTDFH